MDVLKSAQFWHLMRSSEPSEIESVYALREVLSGRLGVKGRCLFYRRGNGFAALSIVMPLPKPLDKWDECSNEAWMKSVKVIARELLDVGAIDVAIINNCVIGNGLGLYMMAKAHRRRRVWAMLFPLAESSPSNGSLAWVREIESILPFRGIIHSSIPGFADIERGGDKSLLRAFSDDDLRRLLENAGLSRFSWFGFRYWFAYVLANIFYKR